MFTENQVDQIKHKMGGARGTDVRYKTHIFLGGKTQVRNIWKAYVETEPHAEGINLAQGREGWWSFANG